VIIIKTNIPPAVISLL